MLLVYRLFVASTLMSRGVGVCGAGGVLVMEQFFQFLKVE